jgi:hypothetical protein
LLASPLNFLNNQPTTQESFTRAVEVVSASRIQFYLPLSPNNSLNITVGPWSQHEDELLERLMQEGEQRNVILRWTDVAASMNERSQVKGLSNRIFTGDSVRRSRWFRLGGCSETLVASPAQRDEMRTTRSMRISRSDSGAKDDPDNWLKAEDDFLRAICQFKDPGGDSLSPSQIAARMNDQWYLQGIRTEEYTEWWVMKRCVELGLVGPAAVDTGASQMLE